MLNTMTSPQAKRPRTVFTKEQLRGMRAAFDTFQYLTTAARQELCASLQLNVQSVKVWFQNQRQKARRKAAADKSTVAADSTVVSSPPSEAADARLDRKIINQRIRSALTLRNLERKFQNGVSILKPANKGVGAGRRRNGVKSVSGGLRTSQQNLAQCDAPRTTYDYYQSDRQPYGSLVSTTEQYANVQHSRRNNQLVPTCTPAYNAMTEYPQPMHDAFIPQVTNQFGSSALVPTFNTPYYRYNGYMMSPYTPWSQLPSTPGHDSQYVQMAQPQPYPMHNQHPTDSIKQECVPEPASQLGSPQLSVPDNFYRQPSNDVYDPSHAYSSNFSESATSMPSFPAGNFTPKFLPNRGNSCYPYFNNNISQPSSSTSVGTNYPTYSYGNGVSSTMTDQNCYKSPPIKNPPPRHYTSSVDYSNFPSCSGGTNGIEATIPRQDCIPYENASYIRKSFSWNSYPSNSYPNIPSSSVCSTSPVYFSKNAACQNIPSENCPLNDLAYNTPRQSEFNNSSTLSACSLSPVQNIVEELMSVQAPSCPDSTFHGSNNNEHFPDTCVPDTHQFMDPYVHNYQDQKPGFSRTVVPQASRSLHNAKGFDSFPPHSNGFSNSYHNPTNGMQCASFRSRPSMPVPSCDPTFCENQAIDVELEHLINEANGNFGHAIRSAIDIEN